MTNVIEAQSNASSIELEVDGQTPESWSDILGQFDDANIYQTWSYGATRWGAHNLSHLVCRRDGQVLAAAQLRIARLPVFSAGVAYLRWGPMCQRKDQPLDPALVAQMVTCLKDEYSRRRKLALQIIPNAYISHPRGAIFQNALIAAGLIPENGGPVYRTVSVDLTTEAEAMRKRLDQKWRNQLNRSEKNGLTFEVGEGEASYREFLGLYDGMMKRKQFESTVDVEEFGRIQSQLSKGEKMNIFLARKDAEPIAALVCSLTGDSAIYLLGATNEKARELKAAYFLQWQAMMWLKERGARSYDLGGIDKDANPGGYHFKAGFGGTEETQLPLHTAQGSVLSSAVAALSKWRRRRSSPAATK